MRIRTYLTAIAIATSLAAAPCIPAASAARPAQSKAAGEKAMTIDEAYKTLPSYEYADGLRPLSPIEEEIRKAGPDQYPAIETKLLAVLADEKATLSARQFVCQKLRLVGSAKSVPVLEPLLRDEKTSSFARYALETMEDPAAGAALRKAMTNNKGLALEGVIASVGRRRDAAAVPALSALAGGPEKGAARAALAALGQIGTAEAAAALAAAAKNAGDDLKSALGESQLDCAQQLIKSGATAPAAEIYRTLYAASSTLPVREGALHGLIATAPPKEAAKFALETFKGEDSALAGTAVAAVRDRDAADVYKELAAAVQSLEPIPQHMLVALLAQQNAFDARTLLLELIQNSKDEPVRRAAIGGLERHASSADIPMLARLASGTGDDATAAKQSLERLNKPDVDDALARVAETASGDAAGSSSRGAAIRALARRGARAMASRLAKLLTDAEGTVAYEAASALGDLGGEKEAPALLSLLATGPKAPLGAALENAARGICLRWADQAAASRLIIESLGAAQSPAGRAAMLRLLGRVGGETALNTVRHALADPDKTIQDAALRALSDSSDPAVAPDLLALAKDKATADMGKAVLALQGYIRLAGSTELKPAQRAEMYRNALAAAQRPEEKRQVLSGLSDLREPETLNLAEPLLRDPALRVEAAVAVTRIASVRKDAPDSKAALAAVEAIVKETPSLKKQIDDAVKAANNKK